MEVRHLALTPTSNHMTRNNFRTEINAKSDEGLEREISSLVRYMPTNRDSSLARHVYDRRRKMLAYALEVAEKRGLNKVVADYSVN